MDLINQIRKDIHPERVISYSQDFLLPDVAMVSSGDRGWDFEKKQIGSRKISETLVVSCSGYPTPISTFQLKALVDGVATYTRIADDPICPD